MRTVAYYLEIALIIYICFGIWLYFNQRGEMYFPNKAKIEQKDMPNFVKKHVSTEDGFSLTAWMHPGNPMLLYFQGNAGNSKQWYPDLKPYIDKGWGILMVPYRGYGGNPGKPTEAAFYDDSELTLGLLHNVPPACTVIYGRSLGSGVATYIARKYKGAALVLHSPFTSAADVAASYYPIYPTEWLIKDRYDSLGRIHFINMPLLIMHGTEDKVVPYSQGVELFDEAMQPKKMVTFQNFGHNNMPMNAVAKAVMDYTKPFLKSCPR